MTLFIVIDENKVQKYTIFFKFDFFLLFTHLFFGLFRLIVVILLSFLVHYDNMIENGGYKVKKWSCS